MSDYEHYKVIRMRVNENFLKEKYKVEEAWELDFCEELKELFNPGGKKAYMRIAPTVKFFLDYVIYADTEADSEEFGMARYLTDEEAEKFLPIFKQINEKVTKKDLRFVDFCWYNGYEAPSYFRVNNFSKSKDSKKYWLKY